MTRPTLLGVAAWLISHPLTLLGFALVDLATPAPVVIH